MDTRLSGGPHLQGLASLDRSWWSSLQNGIATGPLAAPTLGSQFVADAFADDLTFELGKRNDSTLRDCPKQVRLGHKLDPIRTAIRALQPRSVGYREAGFPRSIESEPTPDRSADRRQREKSRESKRR